MINANGPDSNKQVAALKAETVTYPILSWEYISGVTIVTNVKLPYGNVKRYGAVGDGVTNDSPALQKAFDLCSLNGQSIHIPVGTFLLQTPIKLYECFDLPVKRAYKVVGDTTEFSAYSNLSPKCALVTTGNVFDSGNATGIVFVALDMTGIYVKRLNNTVVYTMFNNIILRGSYFGRNRVDSATIWLKGAVREVTTVENNVFFGIKGNLLKESDYSTVSVYYDNSDSIIRNNYIDGDGSQNPVMVLTIAYDSDMIVESNFIDFFAFLFKGTNNNNTFMGIFRNNVVNRCFRLNDGHLRYGIVTGNVFEFCKYSSSSTFFTNPTSDMLTKKWGAVIMDETSSFTITTLILYDNIGDTTDSILTFISADPGDASKRKSVQGQLKEKGTINGNITFQQGNNSTAFVNTKIETLNYQVDAVYGEVIQNFMGNTTLTAYESQHKWMAGVLYIAHLVNSVPVWVETKGGLAGNKGINVTVAGSATTLVVSFAKAEVDNSYGVQVSPAWNTTYWITSASKTTSGFTINFGTAPSGASTLDWSISR